MTWSLTDIYRHPVKSLGEEALDTVALTPGQPMPFDRVWAIAHADTEWSNSNPVWAHPRNFINQTHVPKMVQVKISSDPKSGVMNVHHPDLGDISVHADDEAEQLCRWLEPILEGTGRNAPLSLCKLPNSAFTDFEETHISIATLNSLRALEQHAGQKLEHIRFRMNLWLEGPPAWSELDWVGQEVEIGEARFKIIARDKRCNATNANPSTGGRDTQIPALLHKTFGHMDFGVYAQVVQGGVVKRGDTARLV